MKLKLVSQQATTSYSVPKLTYLGDLELVSRLVRNGTSKVTIISA